MTTFIKDNEEFKLFKEGFNKWCMFMYGKEYPLTDKNVCNYADEVLNYYIAKNHSKKYKVENIVFDKMNLKGSAIRVDSEEIICDYTLVINNNLMYGVIKIFNKHIDDNTIERRT